MAGDWIKARKDLFTHPVVVRIASALKADPLRTVGGCLSVFALFDTHSADGWLPGYTADALDAHLGWAGFSLQMAAAGWLEIEADGLRLPRFDTHNGASAKRRAQEAERKQAERRATSAPNADKTRTRVEKEKRTEDPPSLRSGAAPAGADAFEQAWAFYPRREGGNPKGAARRAWDARRRAGVAEADMLEGVRRYAAYVRAKGKEGTEFVKLAATFLGPDEHFRELWTVNGAAAGADPKEGAKRLIAEHAEKEVAIATH